MKEPLTAIDLFSGAGGFSLGFINAGWHVVAAMDASIMALATYYQNLCDEDTKLIGNFSRKDMELIEGSRKDWRLFRRNKSRYIERYALYKHPHNVMEVVF